MPTRIRSKISALASMRQILARRPLETASVRSPIPFAGNPQAATRSCCGRVCDHPPDAGPRIDRNDSVRKRDHRVEVELGNFRKIHCEAREPVEKVA